MLLSDFRNKLNNQEFKQTFSMMYGESKVVCQTERYLKAVAFFSSYFKLGDDTDISVYSAPGRVEVCGNHTDHQKGNVVATSVHLDIIAIVAKSSGSTCIKSDDYEEECLDISQIEFVDDEKGTSKSLVKGIMKYFENHNYKLGNFVAYLTSDVLEGSGLSSSAAFETVIGTVLNYEFNNAVISPERIAMAGQFAENVYFGKPCGLMDQMASSVGGVVSIDFKDTENPIIESTVLDLEKFNHTLCVIDTGGNHADLTPDYAAIPLEMKSVAEFFGKEYLSEVDRQLFFDNLTSLRSVCGDRAIIRAMHFYEETLRAKKLARLLREQDYNEFLYVVKESGRSSFCYLQNIYSPQNSREQGLSLALAVTENLLKDKGSWRINGGGFAGTILTFVPNEMLDMYVTEINQIFGADSCHKLYLRPVGAYRIE